MIEYAIGTENWRKLSNKDDNGASSRSTAKVQDAVMFSIFGTKIRLKAM